MGTIEGISAVLRTVVGFAGIIVSLVVFYRALRSKPVLKVPDPSLGDPTAGYQSSSYSEADNDTEL